MQGSINPSLPDETRVVTPASVTSCKKAELSDCKNEDWHLPESLGLSLSVKGPR